MVLTVFLCLSLVSVVSSAALSRDSVCPTSCDCNYVHAFDQKKVLELVCFVWDIADFVALADIDIQEDFKLSLKCDSAVPNDIDSQMLVGLPHLTSVTFNQCKISYIHKQAFAGVNNLQEINIYSGSNYHLQLHPNAFEGLSSLSTLVMTGSGILRVPNLCDLGNLRILNVSGNALSNFKQTGLDCTSDWFLQSLQVLDISRNYFTSLKPLGQIGSLFPYLEIFSASDNMIQLNVDEHPMVNFANLRVLDLSRNDIAELPKAMLDTSYDFQEIRLSENRLKEVPSGFFNHCSRLLQLELQGNLLDNSVWVELVNLPNLMYFDISKNELTFLNQTTITDLPAITFLNLADNLIASLPVRTFQNQQRLTELNLAGNQIHTLDNESLHGLLFLKTLSLQNNRIFSMNADVLNSVPGLINLNISHNSLLEIPSLSKLTALAMLDASYNNINNIGEKAFLAQEHIKYINLSHNNIRELPDSLLLSCRSLTRLDLSYNFINYLHPSVFMGLNIQTLMLQRNRLQNIGKLFSNLEQLQELNLSSNEIIDTIQKLMFPKNIEMLDLSDNLIKHIRPYAFDGLGQIRMVDLRHNKISSLSSDALKISTGRYAQTGFRLEENPLNCDCNLLWLRRWNQATQGPIIVNLNITKCIGAYGYPETPIMSIPENSFLCMYDSLCMESCLCCDFEACDCKYKCPDGCECYNSADYYTTHHVQCSNKNITAVDKFIPKIGTLLDYSGNNLTLIETHSFIGMRNVRILLLNNSHIEMIADGSFVGLSALQTLRLNNNRLTMLTAGMFSGLEHLEHLYLDHNLIPEIQDGVFRHMPSLKTLSLPSNQLKVMTDYMSTLVFSVNQVLFQDNPWLCNCILYFCVRDRPSVFISSALGFRNRMSLTCLVDNDGNDRRETALSSYSVNCGGRQNIETTRSYFEELLSDNESDVSEIIVNDEQNGYQDNASVVAMETDDDHGIWSERMMIFIPAIAASTVIFLIIITVMCRRELIKCWLFAKFRCKTSDLELLYDKMRSYDAFVTYHPSDEDFVIRELAIRLERGKPRYQLLLQYRDCPTTSSIPNFISKSIQASHRTVIVLSSAYIADNSFLKCVLESMRNDSVRRLIIITVGEIDSSKVDPVLRSYLKSKNRIRFGERWFWEKLFICLPEAGKVDRDNARAEARPYACSDLARFAHKEMDNRAYEEPYNGTSRDLPNVVEYDYTAESLAYNGSQHSSNIYEEIKDHENTSVKYSEPWTLTQLQTNVEALSRGSQI